MFPKIVRPITNGANPAFDCDVVEYSVIPLFWASSLNERVSLFCASLSSNAIVKAIYDKIKVRNTSEL